LLVLKKISGILGNALQLQELYASVLTTKYGNIDNKISKYKKQISNKFQIQIFNNYTW
jgi:hypothetical protein